MAELEQKTIDELNRLIVTLREYDGKLSKGIVNPVDFEATKSKIELDIKAAQDRLDAIETKANTAAMAAATASDPRDPETKAFSNYMAKGFASPDEMKLISMDSDPNGGIFMPVPMITRIIEAIQNISPIRQHASVYQTDGDSYPIGKEAGTFAHGWKIERGAVAVTGNMTVAKEQIPVHERYAEPKVTQKALDMSTFNFEAWISKKVAVTYAQDEGTAFVSGTGIGKPEGMLLHADVITNHVHSGDANLLTADGIVNLVTALPAQYENGSIFMMRKATVGAIRLFKDANGNYIWQQSYQAGVPNQLCGFPVVYAEDFPAVAASAYPIIFGNINEAYAIADNVKTTIIRDNITDKGSVMFYTQGYVGGQVVNANAVRAQFIAA